jgi:hypothetical protein
MSIMPESANTNEQINDSIVDQAVTALAPFHPESREQAADMLLFWIRRAELTEQDITAVQDRLFPPAKDQQAEASGDYGDGYTTGYLDAISATVRLRADNAKLARLREQLLACPDWCTLDHSDDDPADPIYNLILHTSDAHACGLRVSRTDCPQEGRIGTPSLAGRIDVELTSWQEAAELAHAILDGFGYLEGADAS